MCVGGLVGVLTKKLLCVWGGGWVWIFLQGSSGLLLHSNPEVEVNL